MNRSSFNPDNYPEDKIEDWMKESGSEQGGFKAPDNYFGELPGRIEQAIRNQEKGQKLKNTGSSTSRIVMYRVVPILAAASVIIALFFLFPVGKTTVLTSGSPYDSLNPNASYDASYATEAIQDDYVEMNEMLNAPDAQFDIEMTSEFYESNEITDQDISDYLMDQDLDTDLLAEL